jgi:hypothetical protein
MRERTGPYIDLGGYYVHGDGVTEIVSEETSCSIIEGQG